MNFLERIPTRWLLTGAALACLVLWAGPGWAQAADDPVAGRALYDDTNAVTGIAFTNDCINCHAPGVQNRRTAIGGSAYAAISFDQAMARFGSAIGSDRGGAMGQFNQLSAQQIRDIAAYIADTPKTSTDALSFSASAVNTNTLSQNIDLTNAQTSGTLTITSVAIGGAGAARFNATSDTCTSQTLAASTGSTPSSCRVSVRFSAPDTAPYTGTLTLSMRVAGSMTVFTRTVALSGRVATTPPPSNNGGDSGGGALGLAWLGGLALATLALARRRR